MRELFTCILLFICTSVSAQFSAIRSSATPSMGSLVRMGSRSVSYIKPKKYKEHIGDTDVTIQRTPEWEIRQSMNTNDGHVITMANDIRTIEHSLDMCKDAMNKRAQIPNISLRENDCQYGFEDIKKWDPDFDVTLYKQELTLYHSYDSIYEYPILRRRQDVWDSIEAVKQSQIQAEKELQWERDSALAATAAIRRHRDDSIRVVNDSISTVEYQIQQKQHLAYCIKKYGAKRGKEIASGDVSLGMTKDMCREAWGEPKDINQKISKGKTIETWHYSYRNYLIFENNSLITINRETQ